MKPSPEKQMKAILTEIIPRGDGSFILKPMPVCEDFETWVGTGMASQILGLNHFNSIYALLDPYEPYLVFRRPLRGMYLISLESVVEYKEASTNPLFWTEEYTTERLKYSRSVLEKINKLANLSKPSAPKPAEILPLKLI